MCAALQATVRLIIYHNLRITFVVGLVDDTILASTFSLDLEVLTLIDNKIDVFDPS
jgi:hypothetical protein